MSTYFSVLEITFSLILKCTHEYARKLRNLSIVTKVLLHERENITSRIIHVLQNKNISYYKTDPGYVSTKLLLFEVFNIFFRYTYTLMM